MSAQIVRIEHAGPGSRARRLLFDDETPTRTTSAAAVKHLGLEEGMSIAGEALEESLDEIEYPLAKDRGLMLLGYREHSAAELRRKLHDAGYPTTVCRAVVERFVEVELVDDARFAAAWVRSRRGAGYGTRRIARELEQRGIDAEVIQAALTDDADETDEIQRARRALRGKVPEDRASKDRLLRRLVSRGFSISVALKALEVSDVEDTQ